MLFTVTDGGGGGNLKIFVYIINFENYYCVLWLSVLLLFTKSKTTTNIYKYTNKYGYRLKYKYTYFKKNFKIVFQLTAKPTILIFI